MSSGKPEPNRRLATSDAEPVDGQGAAPAPVDLAHLRRYTLGNADFEREVLGLFLAQLPSMIAALREAGSDRDWKMAAHALKGSGRAVGAWPLARAAEQAEQLPGVAGNLRCQEQVGRIERAAADVRQFIDVAFPQS